MTRHYIAMSGQHGCLPDFCTACSTREVAVETLTDLIAGPELTGSIYGGLSDYGYVELGAGNYAEITACDCGDPAQHCDEGGYEA